MTTPFHPEPPPTKNWPLLHCPAGTEPRSLLPLMLAGEGLTVLTDLFQPGSYWAIVKRQPPDDHPFALLCLTRLDPDRSLRYFIVPEPLGFPLIPPRAFYARILDHCPAPPSQVAQTARERFEKHFAALDALPFYPVGTEFTLADTRMRIIAITPDRLSAIKVPQGPLFLLKPDDLLSATIHPPRDPASQDPEPVNQPPPLLTP